MIPMTTHNLGHEPGRARLGACGRGRTASALRTRTPWGSWQIPCTPPVVDATNVATTPYVGNPTADMDFGSAKRHARYLGKRLT